MMSKGRDHEIVRTLETYLNAIPWNLNFAFCVATGLQVSCKDVHTQVYCMLFLYHPIHAGLLTQEIIINEGF